MVEKYSFLAEFIRSRIYDNDQEAITGQITQEAFLALIADLGKYSQFGGIADLEGDPQVGDAPVIFLADKPGTYTNFGGLTVETGEVAILVYDGVEWSKETLGVLSSAPGAVKETNIADNAVAENKIKNGAVTREKLASQIAEIEPTQKFDYHFLRAETGAISVAGDFNVYEFSITPGKVYLITGSTGAGSTSCLCAFYGPNNTFINSEYPSATYPSQTWERVAVTAPANAVTLCVQAKRNVNLPKAEVQENIYDVVQSLTPGNLLYGKKIAFCGDSNTNGDFTGYTGQTTFGTGRFIGEKMVYPRFIAERNNMQLYMDAINGSIVGLSKAYVDDPDNVDINTRNPFSHQRYLNVPNDSDYLILWFGGNDLPTEEYTGTINDATNETLYGAWNVVLSYFLTNRPFTKIGIIVPYTSTQAIRQVVRDIAEKWGIPYLDMAGDNQVPLMYNKEASLNVSQDAIDLRRAAFCCSPENTHMSPLAHKYQSTFIETWIRSL